MAKIDISVPKGTRDFDPLQMGRRNYIFSTLRSIFEKHGFQPIETPSMEQTSTLLGKYGEEGDRLIFRILNSGDFMSNIPVETEKKSSDIVNFISEKGLRYDLTVPFARFVVMNRNNITFPFRRYQIQPVWRADRPQKGRYREFYQCDVDVIGTKSQMEEAGLIEILDTAFDKFGINVIIKLNNRKLLQGIAIAVGAEDRFIEFTTALDKLDKTGWDGVIKELETIGFQKSVSEKLSEIMSLSGDNNNVISNLKKHINSEIGKQGIQEIEELFDYISVLNLKSEVKFDISLARGLNYYTGAIFEVVAKDVEMGSISGGGRYDNLTGVFGLPDTSGVGVSFGADRIYDVMLTLNLFPANLNRSADLLLINFDKTSEKDLIPIVKQLRKNGIACVIYPEAAKLKKQFSYADAYNFPYVLIRGDEEKKEGLVNIKNMINGKQVQIKVEELLNCTLQKIEELTK